MLLVSVLFTENINVSDGFGGLTKNSAFKLWYENNVELSTKTEEANQKYRQMENKEYVVFAEGQDWLYNHCAASFESSDKATIQAYEPELQKADSTLALDDLRIILAPPGTLCYCDIMPQAYKNVGHTDAIIKQTKWNSIVYTFFGELVDKHSESQALKLFSKELLLHFDEVQVLMVSYSFSEISGIQALMGILSAYKGDSQACWTPLPKEKNYQGYQWTLKRSRTSQNGKWFICTRVENFLLGLLEDSITIVSSWTERMERKSSSVMRRRSTFL